MIGNIKELLNCRALLRALVTRYLAMRYRGSVLGFLWTFLNPLCLMLVYTLVFRYYIRFDSVDNYTIFLFCGLLPWLWVTSGLIEGTTSITSSGHLITKSMFPAQVLPTVSIVTSMVHFLLSLPLLFIFMLVAGMEFHLTLLLVPVLVAVQFLFLYGIILILGALNVYYRDVQHLVGNLLTFLFFLCPILYPREVVPEKFRITLDINPLAVFTECYHRLILDGTLPSGAMVGYLLGFTVVLLLVGNWVFDYYKESFAELL